jgi:2-polyprenyl-3-methyl-5-hydroxy-6-metoxy-1,4-benzoquinol methylase
MRTDELAYQASRAKSLRIEPTPLSVFTRYRELRHWQLYTKEFLYKMLGDLPGKQILDFGCGEGEVAVQLAWLGADVTGMDISPDLIAAATKRAELDAVPIKFVVGDINEESPGTFDAVICTGVLHHVDIRTVLPRLISCVRPGGIIVISEPIALSPALSRIRRLLPISTDASPDEHPLDRAELAFVIQSFRGTTLRYFCLFGRQRFASGRALHFLLKLDRVLLRAFPFLAQFCSAIAIVGHV